MSIVRNLTRASLVVIVGVALSGCVVRPLGWGWGDGGGHRRGGGHYVESDRDHGRSQGYGHPREEPRRRSW